MSDEETKEMWKNHSDEIKQMKKRRCFKFRSIIKELRELGFEVKEVTSFQFRINEMIDIYPSNRKYHNLITRKRGDIRDIDIKAFIKKALGIANYQ